MQVTFNTPKFQQNYSALQNNAENNNLQRCKPKQTSFTAAATATTGLVETLTTKSKFFAPFEEAWDGMTDWLAKNFVARAMNSTAVAKFAEKFKDSKIIVNHITTLGAATGTGMYMYKTLNLPEDKMDSDRKKVLTLNHALTFCASTAGAYLLDGALVGWWKGVTNKYAELYTGNKNIMNDIKKINEGLKTNKKNTIDLIDYAGDYLQDAKLVNRLKGMDIAKKLLIFSMIYRYIVPVAVTPIANKLGDKMLEHKKAKEANLQNA